MPTPMRSQHGSIEITNHDDMYCTKNVDHNSRKFEKYKIAQNQWHQVIIKHNGKYSQIEILDAIYEAITPHDILPCYYKPDAINDSFFVCDSYEPLEALYDKQLLLKTLIGPPIEIVLKMCVAAVKETHINPKKSIESTVIERFDAESKTLNLEKFTYAESMHDVTCRLVVPRTLITVLTFASRKYAAQIEKLVLGYNDLTNLHGTHPIMWMKNLKEIDLSNNKIESIKALESLPKTITSIRLEGNPLCRAYANPAAYVAAVKDAMKNLEKLVRFY